MWLPPPTTPQPPRSPEGPLEGTQHGRSQIRVPYPGAFHTTQVARCQPRVRHPTQRFTTFPPGWPHPCSRQRQCSPEKGLNRGPRSYSTGFRAVQSPRGSAHSCTFFGGTPVEQTTTHIPFNNCRAPWATESREPPQPVTARSRASLQTGLPHTSSGQCCSHHPYAAPGVFG